MPDNTPDKSEAPKGDGAKGGNKKKPVKMILAVMLILGLEVGTIFLTTMLTNTPQLEAGIFEEDQNADEERIVEVRVLDERFPNRKSGVTMLYETDLTVQVKKRNSEAVTQIIEENKGRIQMAIGTIWRNAEPRHFEEPYLDTLTRQAQEILEQIIDQDLPEGEETRVEGVLIPTLTGFRSDN